MKTADQWIKVVIVFAGVMLFRLMPLRAPNVEPILSAVMPLSKRYGAIQAVVFAVLSIVFYDALTAGWGIWTLVPALAYGTLALGSHFYFKTRPTSRANFVAFSIAGVLFYDAATGLTIGPIFEGQSFAAALAGQIPFTLMHLAGSVVFAALVSPALYRWFSAKTVFVIAPQRSSIR